MKRTGLVLCMCMFASVLFAQSHPANKGQAHPKAATVLPSWAKAQHYSADEHAYFPDYYTYYDAKRKGYVFWKDGKWSFTPALPPFLEKVDMSKTRLKLVKGFNLALRPELSYPRYMKMYPATHGNNLVPVPSSPTLPGNP
ncbi:MAG: hypothetical protein V4649_19285 [Bacteroidota bacterium]